MKKYIFLFCFVLSGHIFCQAQTNMEKLVSVFPKSEKSSVIDYKTLLESVKKDIDNSLAWEIIWDKNEFVKPEETYCHPIAQYALNNKVTVLLYSKGQRGMVLFYMIEAISVNVEKGKVIDRLQLPMAVFNYDGKIKAEVEIKADGNLVFSTNNIPLEQNDKISIDMSSKGTFKTY